MRNDPSFRPSDRNRDRLGLWSELTGYAALAAVMLFLVAMLVAGHRHVVVSKQAQAAQDEYFGVEELVDLAAEPAVPSIDLFVLPKRRSITRAELDLEQGR